MLPAQQAKLFELLAQQNCAFYASEFLKGPQEPPYNGKFIAGDHHIAWADLLNAHDRLCVIAPRGHGKCRTGTANITLANGARRRVRDLVGDQQLVALDVEKLTWQEASARVDPASEPVPCLRVRTRTGRTAEVTVEHPFLAWRGWTEARALNVGQRIAVPRRLANLGKNAVDRAWLLGVFVGDGSVTAGSRISKTEPSMRDAIVEEASRCGWGTTPHDDEISLTAAYAQLGDTPRNFLREFGLYGATSHEKRVPTQIFEADDVTIAQFVSGLVDTDCHMNTHDGGSIEFFSVSRELMRDVQHLLVRLGVVAVLAEKHGTYKGRPHKSWRLTVRGPDILILASWLKPRATPRQEALRLVCELQESKEVRAGARVDLFPTEVYELLEHGDDWFRRRGLPRPNRAHEPTREKLIRMAIAEGNDRLLKTAQADILWDEIVEITDIGPQPVYPVHVPGPENYVADDFIDHNSFFFTFAYPLWMAERHPGRSGFIFSASQPQAEEILIRIMREVETNPKLKHLLPPNQGGSHKMKQNARWSARTLEFANQFTLHARGYGTKVRGGHPIFIACDDVLNDEAQYSDLVRTKQNDYFFSAVTNMIEPKGQIVLVGTPQHEKDLLGVLKKTPGYKVKEYPAINLDGSALWPERFSLEELHAIRDQIKSLRFAREYLCEAKNDISSLFPLGMFRGEPVEQFNVKLGMPASYWDSIGVHTRFMGVDFAISRAIGADYTVVFVMGIDNYGNRWVIDILREKGLGFGEQKSLIITAAKKYRVAMIYCEANQMQQIFGDELVKETDLPVKPFYTGDQKHSLEKGLPSLAVLLENRKVRIPRGDDYSTNITDVWIDEMRSHTFSNGKVFSVGEHDDTCMAFWICDQAIRRGSFNFSFEEEPLDAAALSESLELAEREANEDPWADAIPGAGARVGTPRIINGRPVDMDFVDENLDNPRNPHGNPKTVGPVREVVDWRPKDAAPLPNALAGYRR